jgi:hypothetical protein
MNATNFVSYIRVSTTEQGESGLGLEAQRQTVSEYLARESGKLLCEFVEVESGSRNDRAQLQAAIELCKRYKATLFEFRIIYLQGKEVGLLPESHHQSGSAAHPLERATRLDA